MARLCRILTATAFVIHLLVGCCFHHAHACVQVAQANHGHAASHEACSGEADCLPGHGPSGHGQHGHGDCQGVPCSFVLPDQAGDPGDLLGEPFQAAFLPPHNVQPSLRCNPGQCEWFPGGFPLPVRTHLANQVLLI